jgi:hypothetical protein
MIWNIVDRRKRSHRWKRINAIIEPTWHDNRKPDADQAEPSAGEAQYDQRENIGLADAVVWASALRYPVTLFLYDEGGGTCPADPAEVAAWRGRHQP